ncbi:MAG TPA: flagellar motor protein MotB [Acetobacteraceae bacterium]|nr:flagellar motor protein MotB [Acetobacteraceae bacterium]
MAGRRGENKRGGPIVLRREESARPAHHSGAWKVAYADFVTAMMAFFLLMWLLNATTEDQRRGLADYFAPTAAMAHQTSGSGAPFGGRTPFDTGTLVSDRGAMAVRQGKATAMVAPDDAESENSSQLVAPRLVDDDGDPASAQLARANAEGIGGPGGSTSASNSKQPGPNPGGAHDPPAPKNDAASMGKNAGTEPQPAEAAATAAKIQAAKAETAALERAAAEIREAVREDPVLAQLARQLAIDITPQGLRIQLLDEDRQPMFATGSAVMTERARGLVVKIAPILAKLPEPISVTGHTDAEPYRGGDKSNWDLSSERANATRRVLAESGIPDLRFRSVTGAADRDLLLPGDPLAAANRRIAVAILRATAPPDEEKPALGKQP